MDAAVASDAFDVTVKLIAKSLTAAIVLRLKSDRPVLATAVAAAAAPSLSAEKSEAAKSCESAAFTWPLLVFGD